jgi:hypothetical protein
MGLEEKKFREILDRCLEGAASPNEERLLIEAAETSPDRLRDLLELASFDAALKALAIKPDEFARRIIASIGQEGHSGRFAKVMMSRLEKERLVRRPPPGTTSGIPPVVWGWVAAIALIATGIWVLTPTVAPKPLTKLSSLPVEGNGSQPPADSRTEPTQPPLDRPVPSEQKGSGAQPSPFEPQPPTPVPSLKREEPRSLGEPTIPPASSEAKPAPPPEARSATVVAVATFEGPAAGTAFVLLDHEEQPMEVGRDILPGQGLRTVDVPIPVAVRFPDGTRLEIGPNTEIRDIFAEDVSAGASLGKRFRLTKGMVRAVVSKQPKDQPMAIETPFGSLRVLGTTLRIYVDLDLKKGTRLDVEEGKVELKNMAGKAVEVHSGHSAVAAAGMELVAKPISALKKLAAPSAIQDPSYSNQAASDGGGLTAPWLGRGPAAIGMDPLNGRGGNNKCGYIYDGNGTGAWSEIVQTISVAPNTTYTLSCFIQTDRTFPARGLMGIRTTGGTVLAQQAYGQMTDFTQLSVKFNSGFASSLVLFAGFMSNPGQQGAWIHVDDWNMTP